MNDKTGKCGISAVTSLQATLTAVAIALIGYVYGKTDSPPEWRVTIAFAIFTMLPMSGMLLILCLRSNKTKRVYAFDRSSRMFARCMLSLSILAVVVATIAYWGEWLPGQGVRKISLDISGASLSKFKSDFLEREIKGGDGKIIVSIVVHPWEFEVPTLPSVVQIETVLAPKVAKSWRLVDVVGRDFNGEKCKEMPVMTGSQPDNKRIYWPGLEFCTFWKSA